MNIRLRLIELLIKPGDLCVWDHNNVQGTLGKVEVDAEYNAVRVIDGMSVGLKASRMKFAPAYQFGKCVAGNDKINGGKNEDDKSKLPSEDVSGNALLDTIRLCLKDVHIEGGKIEDFDRVCLELDMAISPKIANLEIDHYTEVYKYEDQQ